MKHNRVIKMNRTFILSIAGVIGAWLLAPSCERGDDVDYRQKMREFVIGISELSKSVSPGFIIIPQNGIELVTISGDESGTPHTEYLAAIDGNGQEDLFYGYRRDNEPTPADEKTYLRAFLDISKDQGNIILVTDYCSTHSYMDDSYQKNLSSGYVSFAASHRELDNIPLYPSPIHAENNQQVENLSEVRNFLYLINPEGFLTRSDFIDAMRATNYDLLIMDLFFNDGTAFSAAEISQIRAKANGGRRLVIAYMSIGEAEEYRYYWKPEWNRDPPSWIEKENPDWEGNFKVRYWNQAWQEIIYLQEDSYLDRVLDTGFDGVYLDIIDAYEYFE